MTRRGRCVPLSCLSSNSRRGSRALLKIVRNANRECANAPLAYMKTQFYTHELRSRNNWTLAPEVVLEMRGNVALPDKSPSHRISFILHYCDVMIII